MLLITKNADVHRLAQMLPIPSGVFFTKISLFVQLIGGFNNKMYIFLHLIVFLLNLSRSTSYIVDLSNDKLQQHCNEIDCEHDLCQT